MTTLHDRANRALEAKGLSAADIKREMGAKGNNIYAVLKGSKKSKPIIKKIAEATGCSFEWLLTGTGEIPSWEKNNAIKNQALKVAEEASAYDNEDRSDITFPLAGSATAGGGWAKNDVGEGELIEVSRGLVAVRIEGDSAAPLVLHGQCVLADPRRDASSICQNEIVLVQTEDGEALCKRFIGIEGGKMFLASINRGYDSAIIEADGAVVWPVVGVIF